MCSDWQVDMVTPSPLWRFIILLCDAVLNRRSGQSLHQEYPAGQGEIWMDNLACEGTENNLADCQHNDFAQHNCAHDEDVSISCGGGKDYSAHSCFDRRPYNSVKERSQVK